MTTEQQAALFRVQTTRLQRANGEQSFIGAIREARELGLTMQQIASAAGLSRQRISQLVAQEKLDA